MLRAICVASEQALWLVGASFVPGVILGMLIVNEPNDDVPQYFGRCMGGLWLGVFFAAGLYRRTFRCPRYHRFSFSWVINRNVYACASKLPREALIGPASDA